MDLVLSGEAHAWRNQPHWSNAHRAACVSESLWCIVKPEIVCVLDTVASAIHSMPSIATMSHKTDECSSLLEWLFRVQKVPSYCVQHTTAGCLLSSKEPHIIFLSSMDSLGVNTE